MAKFEVTLGDELKIVGVEIEDVKIIEKLTELEERRKLFRQETLLTYLVLAVFLVATAVTAIVGWFDGSYNELAAALAGGGPWATLVLGRHFKKGS